MNRSSILKETRSATPAQRASKRLFSMRSASISMPTPRAPNRFAAVIGIRPSPDPRSITKSFGPTFASSSIRSTVDCGVGTYGAFER